MLLFLAPKNLSYHGEKCCKSLYVVIIVIKCIPIMGQGVLKTVKGAKNGYQTIAKLFIINISHVSILQWHFYKGNGQSTILW